MQYSISHYDESDSVQLKASIAQLRRDDGSYDPDYDLSDEATNRTFEALQADRRAGGAIFVASDNNQMVGFIAVALSTKNDPILTGATKALFITDVFVSPAYRGKGLGTALLTKAEDFAREHSLRYIKLGVYRANELARRLYERKGFSDYDITMLKDIGSSS